MQQSPSWEANRFAASHEIPRNLWNPKFHYRNHKCPPPVSIPSQLDPVHTPTSWRSILIVSSHLPPGSPQWTLSLRFPHQKPVHASPLPKPRYTWHMGELLTTNWKHDRWQGPNWVLHTCSTHVMCLCQSNVKRHAVPLTDTHWHTARHTAVGTTVRPLILVSESTRVHPK
jgi:hypothetical protein